MAEKNPRLAHSFQMQRTAASIALVFHDLRADKKVDS
jgi:hypothetical protein